MMMTREQIDGFHEFATAKLSNGATTMTIDECFRVWRRVREREEMIAAINESLEDIAAGRVQPLEEVEEELQREFGFEPRQR